MKSVNSLLFKAEITQVDGYLYNIHDILAGMRTDDPELFFKIYAIKKLIGSLEDSVNKLDEWREEDE